MGSIAICKLTRADGSAFCTLRLDGLEILQLGVGVTNEPARAVYAAAGFEVYGVERRALRLDAGRYVDEELRMLDLAGG